VHQKVLIVVPTLNEATHIAVVIRTLILGILEEDAVVVVADGGSSDRTTEIVEELAKEFDCLRLLHNPLRFQSAGINLAVEQYGSSAQILVRCDAHCEYPERYVSNLLQALTESQADSVVVPMDSVGDTCLQKAVAWVSDTRVGSGGSGHRGGRKSGFVDHGHHAAIYLDAFQRAGGYDQTYTHNEDAEFDCRLRALGGRIFLESKIRLLYRPRSTFPGLWRQYFNYGRGRSRTVRKHPGSMRLRQFLVPAHVLVTFFAILLAPVEPALLLWPSAYLVTLSWFAIMICRKRRSYCGSLALPAAMVMHFAWALGFFGGLLFVRQPAWKVNT
jgi:succinoglycan biosynthesis protein ExoA